MEKKDFMERAIELARLSASEGEVPVGAVVVRGGEIVGEGRNRREAVKTALSHAELIAIQDACMRLNGWRLWECEMYVTLEPCPMCAGAILNARIKKVTFGAYDPKNGAAGSVTNLFNFPFTHTVAAEGGYMESECAGLLTAFFSELRQNKAQNGTKQKEGNQNE